MKMKNEKTIFRLVDINMNFLGMIVKKQQTNPNITLNEFFKEFEESIKWDQKSSYNIFNQGVMLTHLYGLILYPKEIFKDKIPKTYLDKVDKNEFGNYEILELPKDKVRVLQNKPKFKISSEKEMTIEFLIRKIRNALAHGNVEILENMDFIFEDEDGTKIKYSIGGLQQLTNKIKSYVITEN